MEVGKGNSTNTYIAWFPIHLQQEGRKEMFYLMTHSTHFIYNIKHQTYCSKRGNLLPLLHRLLFSISSKIPLYAPSHRQDSTYNDLCCTSSGALYGMRTCSMGPPWGIDLILNRRKLLFCVINWLLLYPVIMQKYFVSAICYNILK